MRRAALLALCGVLGACGGPTVSLRYERHYAVVDEDNLFNHVRYERDAGQRAICIHGGQPPRCAQEPWEDLSFEPPWPEAPYLQGQSSVYVLDRNGAASLQTACSDRVEHFPLRAAERRALAAAAERSGFFDMPADLAKLPYEQRADGMQTLALHLTCDADTLELVVDGRRNRVQWDCDTAMWLNQEDEAAPRQIQPLLAAIEKAYAAHSQVSVLLPFAHCPTLIDELARREGRTP